MFKGDYLIVELYNNEVFTLTDKDHIKSEVERAKAHYKRDLELVTGHKENYPEMAEYWQKQIEKYSSILSCGFEAITYEEYDKRQREKYLNKEPKEVTADEYDDMLNVLPPTHWVRNERYSMFCVSECYTMTYYSQYLYDMKKKKYYTSLVDILDKSTWLDKRLDLV